MIKLSITFENKDKEAENTTVSAKFKDFDSIYPWLEKVSTLNDDENLSRDIGFITKGECKCQ